MKFPQLPLGKLFPCLISPAVITVGVFIFKRLFPGSLQLSSCAVTTYVTMPSYYCEFGLPLPTSGLWFVMLMCHVFFKLDYKLFGAGIWLRPLDATGIQIMNVRISFLLFSPSASFTNYIQSLLVTLPCTTLNSSSPPLCIYTFQLLADHFHVSSIHLNFCTITEVSNHPWGKMPFCSKNVSTQVLALWSFRLPHNQFFVALHWTPSSLSSFLVMWWS